VYTQHTRARVVIPYLTLEMIGKMLQMRGYPLRRGLRTLLRGGHIPPNEGHLDPNGGGDPQMRVLPGVNTPSEGVDDPISGGAYPQLRVHPPDATLRRR
jgi:hypothetical protein